MILCWMALWIQSHRLFWKFRDQYPDVARREIPNAFERSRNPEKFFYFFRAKSAPLLRGNRRLWRLRQQVKALTLLSFIVFPLCFPISIALVLLGG